MSLIPQNIIQELQEQIDLVQVIEQVAQVKRSGSNFVACCPFHEEKTPSFHISQAKQLFHCFGCGASGNVFHFLMRYYHLQFPEALEHVAKEVGFDLEPHRKKSKQYQEDKHAREVLIYAKQKFHDFLVKHQKGKVARDYLTSRGISPETVEKYQLGFVPAGWDNLYNALKRDQKSLEEAVKVGIVAKKKNNKDFYDVFRNRLMIPIESPKGDLIGFGARTMGNENPKYLNSPQTLFFDKSKVLFGLNKAERSIRQNKNVYIVEGYFDQIALDEAGIENAVATMGTAMTGYHCSVMKRYTPRLTLVFDGDQAGVQACKKAAKSILAFGIDADVMPMPQGQDPDDFIRANGKDAFQSLPKHPLLDYLIEHFYTQPKDIADKTKFLQEMVEIVGFAKTPYVSKVLKDELCAKMDLNPSIFKEKPSFAKPQKPVAEEVTSQIGQVSQEAVLAVVMYAQSPEIQEIMNIERFLPFLMDETLQNYAKNCILDANIGNQPTKWIDQWANPAYKAMLTQVLVSFEMQLEDGASDKIWADCFSKLKKQYVGKLVQDIQQAESTGQLELVEDLSKKMIETKNYQPMT